MTTSSGVAERAFLPAANAPALDISSLDLPAPLRPAADLSVLDISEYFAETSGGVRTYLLQKARYVEARRDLRQILVVPGAQDAIGTTDGVRCYQLHGPLIPMQKTYRFLLATRSIGRIVAHERPDIVEIGSAYFVPWLIQKARARFDVPAVWFYHSHIPRLLAPRGAAGGWGRRRLYAAGWSYVRRLASMVHTTIVASEFLAHELAREGIARVAQVPLGVDVGLFHPWRRTAREETRRARGLPPGPLVLYVGRLSREKDLRTVLRAWPEVRRRTGATLALVGAGPLRREFEAAGGRIGAIVLPFESNRGALADVIAAADVLLAPGPLETFGLAALEALSSGTPVLACNEGGVAEQVGRSGAGRLYPPGDPAALADAAVAMLGEDLAALGALGRAHAERHHSWDRVFDRIFEIYRGVVRG